MIIRKSATVSEMILMRTGEFQKAENIILSRKKRLKS